MPVASCQLPVVSSQLNLRGSSIFSVCSLENNYFRDRLARQVFLGFLVVVCLLDSDGVPPPMAGILESILSLGFPARSLRNKDLLVKSLFFFHLGTFCC